MKTYLVILLACSLSACSPIIDYHGKKPEPEQISHLKPGLHTRDDVLQILGSPTTQSAFDNNRWYYISETTESKAFLKPKVVEKKIVMVAFDSTSRVKEVKALDQIEGETVEYVERITPTHGHSRSILEQIFGNFGRISRSK